MHHATGASVHFLQELAHRIELSPEAFPISGLQSLHCLIVAIQRLPRLISVGLVKGIPSVCLRRLAQQRFHEQRRQGLSERFFHHEMFTVSCDYVFSSGRCPCWARK